MLLYLYIKGIMKKKNSISEFEKMTSGCLYNPIDRKIIFIRTRARWLADKFNRSRAWNLPRRTWLIKRMIKNHGKNFFFEPSLHIEYGCNITFGDNFYMNFDCQLMDVNKITIGDNCMFGPRVSLATPVHPLLADERISKNYPTGFHDLEYAKPITLGNNIWLATNVTVIGGVTIGDNVVIGAGSVVTRDIPPNVFAAGVPCKVIREITEADRMNVEEFYGDPSKIIYK